MGELVAFKQEKKLQGARRAQRFLGPMCNDSNIFLHSAATGHSYFIIVLSLETLEQKNLQRRRWIDLKSLKELEGAQGLKDLSV